MIAQAPAIWAFQEDIINRNWFDWLIAHSSFGKPLHRYQGQFTIYANALQLVGKDKKTNKAFETMIYKYEIEQLYLGFDEVFAASETRGFGLRWLPLRLTFTKNGETCKLYLIINFRLGKTDNEEYFEFLKQWV